MITMQSVLNQLTGEEIYRSLIQTLTEEFEDFAAARTQYESAMDSLRTELGEEVVRDAMDAIRRQTVSDLLFSGSLGIKANLDNFINPLMRNFLDVDSEIYLRENTARRLPEHVQAHQVLKQFYALCSPHRQGLYEDITEYISYLETVAPKLAHYCGYLLGNELLPRVVPGYHGDLALTAQYQRMLRDYFGPSNP